MGFKGPGGEGMEFDGQDDGAEPARAPGQDRFELVVIEGVMLRLRGKIEGTGDVEGAEPVLSMGVAQEQDLDIAPALGEGPVGPRQDVFRQDLPVVDGVDPPHEEGEQGEICPRAGHEASGHIAPGVGHGFQNWK